MKWFFALNENSPGFWDYANLVQVAVHSARLHTSLSPVCIYDGEEGPLPEWLRSAGVTVLFRRSRLVSLGFALSAIARGTYLRLEIPDLLHELGWNDRHVLYTDCDVLFQQDPVPWLRRLPVRTFAVAPEGDRGDMVHFNAGVMLIDTAAFGAELPRLIDTIRRHSRECLAAPYDQHALQLHFGATVDRLPDELNWKPYWGANAAAPIVHFHGPKPPQKYLVLNRRAPPDLLACAGPGYFALCEKWDRALLAALESHPWPAVATPAPAPDGFDPFEIVEGLGVEEGPFPQWFLPVVRWGFAPRTVLRLRTPEPGKHRLVFVVQCPYAEQRLHVSVDGAPPRVVVFERVSTPVSVAIELSPLVGEHTVVFEYEKAFPQEGDPRPLAVLFRALRVGPTG